jgi:flagellar motor switch protein FliN/FliY
MTGQLSDNEFENLINEGDLSLDGTEPTSQPPRPLPSPRHHART